MYFKIKNRYQFNLYIRQVIFPLQNSLHCSWLCAILIFINERSDNKSTSGIKMAAPKVHSSPSSGKKMTEDQFRSLVRAEILNFVTDNLNSQSSVSVSKVPATNAEGKISPSSPETTQNAREGSPQRGISGANILQTGDLVENRFKVNLKTKCGGFLQAYEAVDTKSNCGVMLRVEEEPLADCLDAELLKVLQGKKHIPVLISTIATDKYSVIVIPQFFRNLSEIRRSCSLKPPRFSVSASYRCALQCLEAVEAVHNVGYVHRDPKPSNYYISKEASDPTTIYLLDYGLCRKYVDKNGSVLPPRENAGFRGTVRYASLTAHEQKDLSRKDDLWSIFYLFVELITGHLPWRKTNDKAVVAKLKTKYSLETLAKPFEISEVVQQIRRLQFADKPDYTAISACFTKVLTKNKMNMEDPYDWQVADCKTLLHWTPPS